MTYKSDLVGQSPIVEILRDMSERLDDYDIRDDSQLDYEFGVVLIEELGEIALARQTGDNENYIEETFDALNVMIKIAAYLCEWDDEEFAKRLSNSINKLV